MASTLFVMDMANLFVGDDDPTKSEYLALKSLKIPTLEETTKDHKPGGGIMAIKIGMRMIEAPEITFKLEGLNLRTQSYFMRPEPTPYTIRGNYRDLKTHTDSAIVAVVRGRMTKVEPSEFSRDEGIDHDYAITELTSYILTIGGQEKYYFDFFAGPAGARVDGNPLFQGVAANLGLI